MPLKLYKISTTLHYHPDCWAGLKKHSKKVYSFFDSNEGDGGQIKNKILEFI